MKSLPPPIPRNQLKNYIGKLVHVRSWGTGPRYVLESVTRNTATIRTPKSLKALVVRATNLSPCVDQELIPATQEELDELVSNSPKTTGVSMAKSSKTKTVSAEDTRNLLEMFASQIHEFLRPIEEDRVHEIIDRKMQILNRIEVVIPNRELVVLEGVHAQFQDLLQLVKEGRRNLLMVGPAGSGKTTLANDVAKALSLDFGFISLSAGVTESHLLGRVMPQVDGSWKYEPSLFVRIYQEGGVFLLDEIDAADANVMVSVNAAMANNQMALPNGAVVKRHKNCYIVAAANTFGRGANAMYVGRNALDAATLDRFVLATVQVDYDKMLEERIAGSHADIILPWVEAVRKIVTENKMRRIVSTRLVVAAADALKAGEKLSSVKERFFQDWTKDELAKIGGLAK